MELTHQVKNIPIKIGKQYKLLSYGDSDMAYRRQLYAHGLIPGAILKLIRIAPFGCPLEFTVDGVALVLRLAEWRTLVWEIV
jgi:ferrous iron transport protein A